MVDTVPLVEDIVTASPPVVMSFPLLSFSWIVIVVVEDPLAINVEAATVIVDCAGLAASVTNFTVALSAIGLPFSVPVMVASPVVTADVIVAE